MISERYLDITAIFNSAMCAVNVAADDVNCDETVVSAGGATCTVINVAGCLEVPFLAVHNGGVDLIFMTRCRFTETRLLFCRAVPPDCAILNG